MEDKKRHIFNCAKEIFSNRGFKDTNITEITEKANIAVGSFYKYYPSKDKLFMEIFLEENAKMKKTCLNSLDLSQPPITIARQMLSMNSEGIYANPILKEWYNKSVFTKMEKIFRKENGLQVLDFLYEDFHNMVLQWQQQGIMTKEIDSKMIMMLFAAIINIDTHKEEIGLEYFPDLQLLLTDLIMKGLTAPNKE